MRNRAKTMFVCFLLLIGILNTTAQQQLSDFKYEDQVGFLPAENNAHSKDFKRCAKNLPLGFYSSSAPYIYKENKSRFREFILENFNSNDFFDNGILNLRFIINCFGEIGAVEVNELNYDFEIIDLNDVLVDKLITLSFRKENWNFNLVEKPSDYYMYLLFRIENGKVVEILP